MRKLLVCAAPLLAACATVPEPVATAQPNGVCRGDALGSFIGMAKGDAVEAQLLAASGARVVRWVTPDMLITMDHREDRLTVRLGTDNRIGSLSCG